MLVFPYAEEWQEVAIATSGFEGFEQIEAPAAVEEPAATAVEPEPPGPVVPPVATVPIEIFTPPAAIRFSEPLEIMDYEEFEPYDEPAAAVEPEPEPEPEPPSFVIVAIPIAVSPIAPAAAKSMPALGAVEFAEAQPALLDAVLPTVRRKIVLGRDPNAKVVAAPEPVAAPKPEPEPEPIPAPTAAPAPPPPAPEKPKVTVRPVPPPPVDKDRRRPARDHGNAVPVEREVAPPPPPAPKPKVMPMPSRRPEVAPEPVAPAAAARLEDAPTIGLPGGSSSGMSGGVKIAVAGAVLAVLSAGGYFVLGGKSEKAAPAEASTSSLIVGGGGWTTTWGKDAPFNKNKQISIYRPSMAMTDYRFEFRGQIERKALGWIFRASDAKNFYVMKLEMMKPGPQPLVALVKYAVIDGKETTRTQVMLPFEVKLDTVYSVRLDVNGDKFSTYVQDKLVDFWNDGRVKVGGAGFYADAGERGSIKSSQLSYLTAAAK